MSWSGEGLATPLSSYRPASFITPTDRLDLCTWEKKEKATKIPPHIEQSAARIKDYCITFLCCIQSFFGLSSLPDIIYHDYPPSSVSELTSSTELQLHMHIKKTKDAHTVQVSSQRTNFQLVCLSSSSNLLFSSLLFLSSIYWFYCRMLLKSEHQILLHNIGLVTEGLWWSLLWAPGRWNTFFEKLHLFLDCQVLSAFNIICLIGNTFTLTHLSWVY